MALLALVTTAGAKGGHTGGAAAATDAGFEAVVAAFRAAIVDDRPAGLVALIHPRGMTCADELIPKSRMAARLTTSGAEYHAMFFSSVELRTALCGDRGTVSVRDLLSAPDVRLTKSRHGRGGSVMFESEKVDLTFSVDFGFMDGRWWLTGLDDC